MTRAQQQVFSEISRIANSIEKFNRISYKKDNSKRIIIGTLKPNCDNSLKRSN